MPSLPISTVRQNLFGLVQQVNDDHDPLTVVTKTGENAVLVAESDWNSLLETLYVLRTHGGVQLLKSAEDAREGRTEARDLLDPDAPTVAEPQATGTVVAALELVRAGLAEGASTEQLTAIVQREIDRHGTP
ncbi:type II toxin-antitoxin system Phd/YefM family antitoxin [Nocardia sp. NPDC057353]|uniref:type II toxin-antitoxin system Phd/YefM family antitoxin n=1 Tax=Nocardia sp. NPDC057353 TaxID=3346104 RepID=UPI003624F28B